jgi:hypothetical protein
VISSERRDNLVELRRMNQLDEEEPWASDGGVGSPRMCDGRSSGWWREGQPSKR